MSRTTRAVPYWAYRLHSEDVGHDRDAVLRLKGADGRNLTDVAASVRDGRPDRWDNTWGRYRRPKAKVRISRILRRTQKHADRAMAEEVIAEMQSEEQERAMEETQDIWIAESYDLADYYDEDDFDAWADEPYVEMSNYLDEEWDYGDWDYPRRYDQAANDQGRSLAEIIHQALEMKG